MATYFAHSINQVDKDGANAGDCLACVLANPKDKDAILQALRDNLLLMNQMREDRITAEKATVAEKIVKAREKAEAAEAERDTRIAEAQKEADAKVEKAHKRLAAAEAERDALGTKPEAQAIIRRRKLDEAVAKKQEAEAEAAAAQKQLDELAAKPEVVAS